MPPGPRHSIRPGLDARLREYSERSWNSYEAVFSLQQLATLAPVYTEELRLMYGRSGLGDARRAWGAIADLVSAMTGLPATMATLLEVGMEEAAEVGHIIDLTGEFALAAHPILKSLDFRPAGLGDLEPVIIHAVAHDRVAKPLLELLRDEMHAFDLELMSAVEDEVKKHTFGDLMHALVDEPTEFPWWDGRPMFLEEQKAFLEYLSRHVAAEIVAESLVDESLGMFVLYLSGHLRHSDVTNTVVLNADRLPHRLLGRPVGVLCHQVGNTILEALKAPKVPVDIFDRLFIIERAVLGELDIDISSALAATRNIATDRSIRAFTGSVIDLTDRKSQVSNANAVPYDFPDFNPE